MPSLAQAEEEPLHIGALRVLPAAEAALERCWRDLGQRSLYGTFEGYRELVEQVRGAGGGGGGDAQQQQKNRGNFEFPRFFCCCFLLFFKQVLSRDIRSVTQRVKVPQREQRGGPAALSATGGAAAAAPANGPAAAGDPAAPQAAGDVAAGTAEEEGYWKVVLDGIKLSYDVEEGSNDVVLRSAQLA